MLPSSSGTGHQPPQAGNARSNRAGSANYTVKVFFMNGSRSDNAFDTFHEAHRFCRRNISYSGGKVRRVEIWPANSAVGEAVYDLKWDQLSKSAGLRPRY